VVRLARYSGRSPDRLGPEEVRAFLLSLIERGVSWSLFNQTVCALKLFYTVTLQRPDVVSYVAYGKRAKTLPVVLAPDEVVQRFDAARPGVERVLVQTDYALGLRVSELVRLQVEHLDSRRMVVHVHAGKGRKDRLVPLSPKLLEELRAYWRQYRPAPWLFPGTKPDAHRSAASVQRLVGRVARRAGLAKAITVHTLRHSYATHQLEAGLDLLTLQRVLGHQSLKTTAEYVHLTTRQLQRTPGLLEWLARPTPEPLPEGLA
jgi:site-specific recombinase XerD